MLRADSWVLPNRRPRWIASSALVLVLASLLPSRASAQQASAQQASAQQASAQQASAQQASAPPLVLEPMRVTPLVQVVVTTPLEIHSDPSGPSLGGDPQPAATTAGAATVAERSSPWDSLAGPASTARETPSHEASRCADGQGAYFDPRSQIYRPCPAPATLAIPRSEPRVARGSSPRAAHLCPPGARAYFDERNQLYRPCPERGEPAAQRADTGRSPAASRAPASSSRPRCAPGARTYYDEANQLYRPCP